MVLLKWGTLTIFFKNVFVNKNGCVPLTSKIPNKMIHELKHYRLLLCVEH